MIEDDSDLANIVREHLIRYDFEVFICEDFKNIDTDDYANDIILLLFYNYMDNIKMLKN